MSNTIRWYQIPRKIKKLNRYRKSWIHLWKYINPFYYRHDHKIARIEQHRVYRHRNRIRIQKGMEILIEPKTNGWLTY